MPRVKNGRLRALSFSALSPDTPMKEIPKPSRAETASMAYELLQLRKLSDLAFMYFEQEDMDPPDGEDAMDAHQREIDETGEKLREAIETYRKGK